MLKPDRSLTSVRRLWGRSGSGCSGINARNHAGRTARSGLCRGSGPSCPGTAEPLLAPLSAHGGPAANPAGAALPARGGSGSHRDVCAASRGPSVPARVLRAPGTTTSDSGSGLGAGRGGVPSQGGLVRGGAASNDGAQGTGALRPRTPQAAPPPRAPGAGRGTRTNTGAQHPPRPWGHARAIQSAPPVWQKSRPPPCATNQRPPGGVFRHPPPPLRLIQARRWKPPNPLVTGGAPRQ